MRAMMDDKDEMKQEMSRHLIRAVSNWITRNKQKKTRYNPSCCSCYYYDYKYILYGAN